MGVAMIDEPGSAGRPLQDRLPRHPWRRAWRGRRGRSRAVPWVARALSRCGQFGLLAAVGAFTLPGRAGNRGDGATRAAPRIAAVTRRIRQPSELAR